MGCAQLVGRPVAQPGAADQIVDWHKAPLVRVEAVGAIVAEDEVVPVGNDRWLTIGGKVVAGQVIDVRLERAARR